MSSTANCGDGWCVPSAGAADDWSTAQASEAWNPSKTEDIGQTDSALMKNFGGDDGNYGKISDENNADFANMPSDQPKSGCFNCGEDGHNKADCPHPRKFSGACRNCNEEGHMSKDCPTRGPMVCRSCNEEGHMSKDCPARGPMVCRACNEEGHMSKECPNRGPMVCTNCNQEGHSRAKCENPRVIDRSHVADTTPDDAWNELEQAIKERDMDDAKAAIEKYSKACPDMTYVQLQEGIFDQGLNLFLIAKERELLPTYTNMDLQGNLNKKYSISYRFSDQPQRPKEADAWPSTREEILSRLDNAGIVVEQSVPYCTNCQEMGHIRKHCKVEQDSNERPTIMCYNCNETGHRVRDCPQPRSARNTCRNCGKPGHKANECEEPRSAANIDCRKCGEMGHFSRDCPQNEGLGSGEKRACHTCGSEDHLARECPDKKDKGNDFYTKNVTEAKQEGDSAGDATWETSGSGGGSW